ncbi:MAG: hypothetical protein AMXMBFR7_43600 [Planctomycetota bacterium]
MPGNNVIYDWSARKDLRDWKLEGHGELKVADDGALHVRTLNHGPLRRASNAWLKDLQLPEAFEVQWDYRHDHLTGGMTNHEGVMLLFNALPMALRTLWEDPRPYAVYSDIFSYRKMVCYSYGFCRSPFGQDSQLRKLGGAVPPEAGESRLAELAGKNFDELTVLSKACEPIPEDQGREYHTHRVRREGAAIQVWCDDTLLHDLRDTGQYQFHKEPLQGGHLGFRNWAGYIDGFYRNLVVRRIG